MTVVFDASILIDLFNPNLKNDRRIKLDYLIETLQEKSIKILIPAPAFTELMVKAGSARNEYYARISKEKIFRIEPFDTKAAMNCALLLESAWSIRDGNQISKTKFKFDWQIISIAVSCNAQAIYSDDDDIFRYGERVKIPVYKTNSLPLPPQGSLPFEIR